jgi:putative FmdB family regulatory protein
MPIYEYRCTQCSFITEFTKLKSIDEEPSICPQCGSPLIRDISAPAIAKLASPAYGVL